MREPTSVGRALAVLAACGLALGLGLPAAAAQVEKEKVRFEFGLDRESWFWQHQRDEQVEAPVDSPPPLPTLNQRVRIPTTRPVPEDSLPVEVVRGEHQMVAALAFDLATRGVTLGSEIQEFVLFLEETTNRQEMPSANAESAQIEACRITQSWPARYNDPRGNDGQEWSTRPEFDETACVLGEREAKEGTAPIWIFDLTEIAQPWGENPFDNQGVILISRLPEDPGPQETWHVQFKIPTRDRAATPEDEYKMSADRLLVDLAFVPGEIDFPEPPPPPPAPPTGGGTTISPSTTFGGSDTPTTTAAPPTGEVDEGQEGAAPVATTTPVGPQLPGYVWALLPVGLLLLGAVRSVVSEPMGGVRPDGVIAAIRRRNAERRGAPLRPATNSMVAALASTKQGLGRAGRAVTGAMTKVTRSVRRR